MSIQIIPVGCYIAVKLYFVSRYFVEENIGGGKIAVWFGSGSNDLVIPLDQSS